MYGDLVYATPGPAGGAASPSTSRTRASACPPARPSARYSPRSDVTIVRDKGFGVPHVYGTTRDGAMFGLGYVGRRGPPVLHGRAAPRRPRRAVELRRRRQRGHGRRAVGGRALHRGRPRAPGRSRRRASSARTARRSSRDVDNYIAGINQYIAEAKLDPTKMPGEYAAIGHPQGPEPWKRDGPRSRPPRSSAGSSARAAATSSRGRRSRDALDARFGKRQRRKRVFKDFRAAEDPEAPVTVLGKKRFPYQAPPKQLAPRRRARSRPRLAEARAARREVGARATRARCGAVLSRCWRSRRRPPTRCSSPARESPSGHPLMVAGPQVAYFNPQILMEEDVHAPAVAGKPGIDARGAVVRRHQPLRPARPRARLRVERDLGRPGQHRHVRRPASLPATTHSTTTATAASACRSRCSSSTNRGMPDARRPDAGGLADAARRAHQARASSPAAARSRGKPVAVHQAALDLLPRGRLRRRLHGLQHARARSSGPATFQRAARKIGYTFNWFYADSEAHRVLQLRRQPGARRRALDHDFPVAREVRVARLEPGRLDRRASRRFDAAPAGGRPALPRSTGTTSRRAGFRGSDANAYSSDVPLACCSRTASSARSRASARSTLPKLIDAMELAGTTDLRAHADLPLALRVIGRPARPALRGAVDELRAWRRARRPAPRRRTATASTSTPTRSGSWTPGGRCGCEAQFRPALGAKRVRALTADRRRSTTRPTTTASTSARPTRTAGTATCARTCGRVLGRKVRGPYSRVYCGGGQLKRCRAALRRSLAAALTVAARATLYGGDAVCAKRAEGERPVVLRRGPSSARSAAPPSR